MKSILAWILSLTFVVVATDSIADKWWYFAGDSEPFYGTWINMDYGGRPAQKKVYNPDGTGWSTSQDSSGMHRWRTKFPLLENGQIQRAISCTNPIG